MSAFLAACDEDTPKSIEEAILENCEYGFQCEGELYNSTYEDYIPNCQNNKMGYNFELCRAQVVALMECPIQYSCDHWSELEKEKDACTTYGCMNDIDLEKGCQRFQDELDECIKKNYSK